MNKTDNNQDFGDDRVFLEQDEEVIRVPFWKRALKVFVGLLFIVLISYLFIFYQFFILRETPGAAEPRHYDAIVSGEELSIGMNVYIINPDGNFEEEVFDIVEDSESIWGQANIRFEIGKVEALILDKDELRTLRSDPSSVASDLDAGDKLSVYLVDNLSGLNGLAYYRKRAVFVSEYTSHFDYRTLAHEIGHILGLSHTLNKSRLMSQGSYGEELTIEEVLLARSNIETLNE